jgi:hypothetical protein
MEYLRSQVELSIPVDDDQDVPPKIEEFNLKLVMLSELGFLDLLKERISDNTDLNLARFLTVMCDEDPADWRNILAKLKNLKMENEKDVLTELNLNKAHEIMSVFNIELEKE